MPTLRELAASLEEGEAAAARQLAAPEPRAISSGSAVAIGRTRRPVKEYAILDSDLSQLTSSGRLTTLCGSLASGSLAFASSCWLQLQGAGIDPIHQGRIEMGQWFGLAGAAIFGAIAAWQLWTEHTLIQQIRRTSVDITTP